MEHSIWRAIAFFALRTPIFIPNVSLERGLMILVLLLKKKPLKKINTNSSHPYKKKDFEKMLAV
jgi:hypothetical protein